MDHHHDSLFGDPRTWVGVAFIIFFVIFGRRLWSTVTGILDKRAIGIRAELDEAGRLRQEAEMMLRDARAQRETALRDAEAMLARARDEAARVGKAARAEAAATATRRERLALDRIASAEKAVITEVRTAAADIGAKAAAQVLAQEFSAEDDSPTIDRAILALPAALGRRRAA